MAASISLAKNQTISLAKDSGIRTVQLGLGWDAAKAKKGFLGGLFGGNSQPESIDLDASCLILNSDKEVIDTVWFRQLRSQCGAVKHSGDNLTGEGDGDDEVITVSLEQLPSNAKHLVFTCNSFRGQTFNEVDNAYCRIVNAGNSEELAKFNISESGTHTGMVMAALTRGDNGWTFKAIGDRTNGSTQRDLLGNVRAAL